MGKQSYLSSSDRMSLGILLGSNDYGWEINEGGKRYILTNPEDVLKFDIMSFVSAFRGSGHSEWEAIWGWVLIDCAGKAVHEGTPCDISTLFNRDYLATRDRRFTGEQVWNHIKRFFTIESETDEEVVMKLNC